MEYFAWVLVLWSVITLVGHVSFLAIAAIFRSLRGGVQLAESQRRQERDLEATRHVVMELFDRGLLTAADVAKVRDGIVQLTVGQAADNATPDRDEGVTTGAVQPSRTTTSPLATTIHNEPIPTTPSPSNPTPSASQEGLPIASDTSGVSPSIEPILMAEIVPTAEPTVPAISRAEIIRSFLAANNIRWGELVAGLLIVVCSIGLVISLWNTISDHRLVPSMIFLGANAAIYAAGFYTLARWRLRHTSRAVLVIATLLVPLTVLAGIAAAGNGRDTIPLTDPLTMLALGLAGTVYTVLVYCGGRTLGRRPYGLPVALAVAGPTAVIPFLPAAVRMLGPSAGWLVMAGSLAIFAGLSRTIRMRALNASPLGIASGRSRILVMGFASFAMSVTVGFAKMTLRTFGQTAFMNLALATLPGIVALAAAGWSLRTGARHPNQRTIGTVLSLVAVGLSLAFLPPSTIEFSWIWLWGIVLAVSAAATAWAYREPHGWAAATLPLGIAVTLTSTVWMGDQAWEVGKFWNHCIAGESMLAAALVAAVLGAAGWLLQSRETIGRSVGLCAIGWLSVSFLIAIALTVAPATYLGVVPIWSVTGVLILGVLLSVRPAAGRRLLAVAVVTGTAFASASVFRPLGIDDWFEFASPVVWMRTCLATSAGLMLLSEYVHRFIPADPDQRSVVKLWNHSGCVVATLAAGIACSIATDDWTASAVALAAVSGLLLWSTTLSDSSVPMIACQSTTVVLMGVIGYGCCPEELYRLSAWQTGIAPWVWAIALSVVVGLWLGLRQLVFAFGSRTNRRLQHWQLAPSRFDRMPIAAVSQLAVGMIALGAIGCFARLLFAVWGLVPFDLGIDWQLPALAFTSIVAMIASIRYQESMLDPLAAADLPLTDPSERPFSDSLAGVTLMGWVAWLAVWLADRLCHDSQLQLVIAASTLSFVCGRIGTGWLPERVRWLDSVRSLAGQFAAVVIIVSSAALLKNGWLEPVLQEQLADRFATLAVVTWAAIGAVVLYIRGSRLFYPASIWLSALLVPAAASLIVPAFYQTHPVVWIQFASIASGLWWLVAHWMMRRDQSEMAQPAVEFSRGFVLLVGIGSAIAITVQFIFNVAELSVVDSLAGVCAALIAIVYACTIGLDSSWDRADRERRLPWGVGIAWLAGPIASVFSQLGLVTGIEVVELIAAIWLVTSVLSLLRHDQNRYVVFHIVAVALGLLAIDASALLSSTKLPSMALAGVGCAGCLVGLVGGTDRRSLLECIGYRIVGWFVIGGGCYLLATRFGLPADERVVWTVMIGWTSAWVMIWRAMSIRTTKPEHESAGQRIGLQPDLEFAVMLGVAALFEGLLTTTVGHEFFTLSIGDQLFIARMVAFAWVAASAVLVGGRSIVWTVALATALSVISLVSVRTAIAFDATVGQRFASAALPAAFMVAMLANWIQPIASQLSRFSPVGANRIASALTRSTCLAALTIAGLTTVSSMAMIADRVTPADISMTIVGVALSAWAIAIIADSTGRNRLRHVAVSLALISIGLWASVNPVDSLHPMLIASMRWLVASVYVIPTTLFVVPKMLGREGAQRWRGALHQGAMIGGVTAAMSLMFMLGCETIVRSSEGITGISQPLVIGVAVTLAILSTLSGWVAILTGPMSHWRERLALSDRQRTGLIYVAQALGAITWLHVFLCKTDWAFVGIRGYWPFIVMGLAFISVGATEWARRRGDAVLARTLKRTALYLPMIPVIGFWFGLSADSIDWVFGHGRVRYDVLLTIGAIYYIAVSSLWKEFAPRIAAIVLGNAAWWIVLVQQAGWGFMAHPQMWLIPPAVCVLVVIHLDRNRLQPSVVTAVRYAATLVIYVSSTADMLFQQIGHSISGPIILVSLALVGMVVGVILRVRPFLYLGALFVFLGVTSMVWHAATSIDQVWPWWVFGITAGICLLGGLMAIEKNKPMLRRYANELSNWQG